MGAENRGELLTILWADAHAVNAVSVSATKASLRMLVGLRVWRQLEGDAAIIVQLLRGVNIEIGECDLPGMAGRQIKKSLANDGIVSDFELATVFEHEHSRILRRLRRRRIRYGALC